MTRSLPRSLWIQSGRRHLRVGREREVEKNLTHKDAVTVQASFCGVKLHTHGCGERTTKAEPYSEYMP